MYDRGLGIGDSSRSLAIGNRAIGNKYDLLFLV
jgi:hypothetical protein